MRFLERIRTDRFVPTASVFPAVDPASIGKDLQLAVRGEERGNKNLPPTEQINLDSVEHEIIERMTDLRLKGLENYAHHRKIYLERLNRAKRARAEMEAEAADAKANFLSLVTEWKSRLVSPREAVGEVFSWREEFRREACLRRPAEPARPIIKGFAIGLFFVFVEAVLNGWLFGQRHDFGLMGGWFIAALISVVNVLVSNLFGNLTRLKSLRRTLSCLWGYVAIIGWLAFVIVFILGVAHFRGVE